MYLHNISMYTPLCGCECIYLILLSLICPPAKNNNNNTNNSRKVQPHGSLIRLRLTSSYCHSWKSVLPRYPRNRAPHCSWALPCCSPHMPRPKPWQLGESFCFCRFLWNYQRCTGSQEMFPTLPSGRNSNFIKFLDIRNSELQNHTKHKAFHLKNCSNQQWSHGWSGCRIPGNAP